MMKKNENGRSMIEMIMVLALIGVLTVGSILAYKNGETKNEANKIHELVSIASLNGLTRIKSYNDERIWNVIGKKRDDYKCVDSLSVNSDGQVTISFKSACNKVRKMLTSQWGSFWKEETNTYTPPKDDE